MLGNIYSSPASCSDNHCFHRTGAVCVCARVQHNKLCLLTAYCIAVINLAKAEYEELLFHT